MKRKSAALLLCICLLVPLLLSCNLLSAKPDVNATVVAAVAATNAARASASAQAIAAAETPTRAAPLAAIEMTPPAVGQTVAAQEVEVFLPPGQDQAAADISITPVEEPLPPPPQGSTAIGQAVDITAAEPPSAPVLVTFRYNPADLSPGASPENLYIATQTGDEWHMVPDGVIDTANHTVSVSVDHFSIYSLFESATEIAYGMVETLVGDEIGSADYTDLPRQIRRDLDRQDITPQDIATVIRAQLSLATKAASGVISLGNLVSKTAGLAIGATDGKAAVAEAMAEALVAEAGGELGSLGVILYDSYTLGTEIGAYMADAAGVSPPALAAKAAAWLLTMEMQYINANIDQGLEGLWRLNTISGSRLSVFVVYVDAEPWSSHPGWGAKGVMFYYYDDDRGEWLNYHNAMTYWKTEVEVTPRLAAAPNPTRTARPTATRARPTATRTARPTATRTPRPKATSTRTATPTRTATSTATATPTRTSTPTATPTPTPEPTFDLEVILKWDSDADLDLTLILNNGSWEISHVQIAGNPSADPFVHSGDSHNVLGYSCSRDSFYPEERIYTPHGGAPAGEYWVQVFAGRGCSDSSSEDFEIIVRADGREIARTRDTIVFPSYDIYLVFTLGD